MKNEEYEAPRERARFAERTLQDLGESVESQVKEIARRIRDSFMECDDWHMNGSGAHAPYQTMCLIITKDKRKYAAELYSFNSRFHSKAPVADRWRRPEPNLSKKERWIDDEDVVVWKVI